MIINRNKRDFMYYCYLRNNKQLSTFTGNISL